MMADLCEVVNAAIHHNNRGCTLYQRGEKQESRAAFQTACSILHPVVLWWLRAGTTAIIREDRLCLAEWEQAVLNNDEAMLQNAHNAIAEAATRYRYDDVDPGDTFVLEDHGPSSRRSEDGLLFANDAIRLPPVVPVRCSDPHCSCRNSQEASFRLITTTAAIVMNLALTFVQESELDTVHALGLFERAYDLAIKEPVTCYLSERVVLISLNNATQLQSELGDVEQTKEYADTLIHLIHSLPLSFDEARCDFRSSCMLNAVVMMGPIIARAA
jgi:tetratricopeptide (TPR) repeat protein